jgi:predicted RNase H-like HicB family nuclease
MKKKSTRSYTVFFEAAEGGGYVATVPLLPGCHTQGESLEQAERNVVDAIELYIEALVAHGQPVPEETKTFQGTVRVPA